MSIRIPEELKIFEEMGFSSMAEFVKTALEEYIENHNFEVSRASDILNLMGDMIMAMEADRDLNQDGWTEGKNQLLDNLYASAKTLASSDLLQNAPVNILDSIGEDGTIVGKVYKYQWAL